MQSFIVLASLVSELAGGVKMTPSSVLNVTKKHLSPFRDKVYMYTYFFGFDIFNFFVCFYN